MAAEVRLTVDVETEDARLQAVHAITLRSAFRNAYGGTIACIELELRPGDAVGPAKLGPAEARELARYLIALADTTTEARRP